MGGIDTDVDGRTSLAGLYAAGEVACTGVHGANRLASNSLLEGLVFGARAAAAMTGFPRPAPMKADRVFARPEAETARELGRKAEPKLPKPESEAPILDIAAIQNLMWREAGLFRTREGLADAVGKLEAACERGRAAVDRGRPDRAAAWRAFNLASVARLIARAALRREESRGGHFRADYPARDDLHWKVHILDERDIYGQQAG
jgi:L-aspartate oxidase